ncbi:MAG: hypothetical protein ACU83N_09980 [Gammaproteobacteria bacterium]
MKKADLKILVIVIIALTLGMISLCQAAELSVGVNNPNHPEWGFMLFIGESPGVYTHSFDAGLGAYEAVIKNLVPLRTYYIAAKFYDPALGIESENFSNEITHTVPSEITILPNLPVIDEEVKKYQITIEIKKTQ